MPTVKVMTTAGALPVDFFTIYRGDAWAVVSHPCEGAKLVRGDHEICAEYPERLRKYPTFVEAVDAKRQWLHRNGVARQALVEEYDEMVIAREQRIRQAVVAAGPLSGMLELLDRLLRIPGTELSPEQQQLVEATRAVADAVRDEQLLFETPHRMIESLPAMPGTAV